MYFSKDHVKLEIWLVVEDFLVFITNKERKKRKKRHRPLGYIKIFWPQYKLFSNMGCLIDQSVHLWKQHE